MTLHLGLLFQKTHMSARQQSLPHDPMPSSDLVLCGHLRSPTHSYPQVYTVKNTNKIYVYIGFSLLL